MREEGRGVHVVKTEDFAGFVESRCPGLKNKTERKEKKMITKLKRSRKRSKKSEWSRRDR